MKRVYEFLIAWADIIAEYRKRTGYRHAGY
jgi:hypothetical protein